MLSRLLYHSEAEPMARTDLAALIDRAAVKNRRLGVTGALFYCQTQFVQLLEGHRLTISDLYLTIAADPRHRNVSLMRFEEIPERAFSHWGMADISDCEAVRQGYRLPSGEFAALEPHRMSAEDMLALLARCRASLAVPA